MPIGFSVLEASRRANIPHASICGGRGRCTLCRVRLIGAPELPLPGTDELRFLRRLGADPVTVRLGCQIRPTADISVVAGASRDDRFVHAPSPSGGYAAGAGFGFLSICAIPLNWPYRVPLRRDVHPGDL